jgi:hypothetical protein
LQLQNAETVKLIGPSAPVSPHCQSHNVHGDKSSSIAKQSAAVGTSSSSDSSIGTIVAGECSKNCSESERDDLLMITKELGSCHSASSAADPNSPASSSLWQPISVSELKEGDVVYTYVQEGARHTGLVINEFIIER